MVTNGLGGYAAGTVAGAKTRRYHGLLVASIKPPTERVLANFQSRIVGPEAPNE